MYMYICVLVCLSLSLFAGSLCVFACLTFSTLSPSHFDVSLWPGVMSSHRSKSTYLWNSFHRVINCDLMCLYSLPLSLSVPLRLGQRERDKETKKAQRTITNVCI